MLEQMDSIMANYRQLHCKMWSSDNWFINLTPEMKLLFIYLFSNERASMTGLYEIPLRIISFETGLERDQIQKMLETFIKADKIEYDFEHGVIWIKNMAKYQVQENPNVKVRTRIKADIDATPDCEIKRRCIDTLSIRYGYRVDTIVYVSVNDPSLSEEGGTGGEIFISHFGTFNGPRERKRWEALVDAIGVSQAKEIAAWAEKKEIHMLNRGGLLDSMETAAKKWIEKQPKTKGDRSDFLKALEKA